MIPEIGLFCLILAFFTSALHMLAPLAPKRFRPLAIALGAPLSLLQLLLISAAFGILMFLRITSDFSVLNVASHSSRALPLLFRVAGTWGNHEGSMLLWVWVLSFFGGLMALRGGKDALIHTALSVHAFVSAGFLLFILCTSNPFARQFPPPHDGAELNPLLQDIGLAMHPPLLYLGYVGFALVFSLAVAGLLEKRADARWARLAQPWILASWSALTLGIGMGGWWAYRELGWGGWWFWDPVENASLLPWLAGTALLHSNIVLQKRNQLAHWVLLLAIFTFSLSLMGTFLVRSGVLTSVHSFASDPARGYFILGYMIAITGGALLTYGLRAPAIATAGKLTPASREGLIVINNLFLLTACFSVLLGTLYPLFAEWLQGSRLTVGPPYFNAVIMPLMVIPLFLAGIAPLLPWKRARVRHLRTRFAPALAAAGAALMLVLLLSARERLLASLGMALAAWLATASLLIPAYRAQMFRIPLRQSLRALLRLPAPVYAVTAAHLGAAMVVAGITGSSLWHAEAERMIRPGDSISLQHFRFEYKNEQALKRGNHVAKQGEFTIHDNHDQMIAMLSPEYRTYTIRNSRTSEVALHSRPWYDLYAVIGESSPTGATSAHVYINPMMQFIWGGFLLMTAGGLAPLVLRKKPAYGSVKL